ncbi:DUF3108 domain-containing protein [Rhizobacter sp. AJA081-3]|uniref:DUF3108 domain-containing protein n=1 Tax=Rhizobacter sp. AJA081-3 TaxID=2753607 RepID=UPI001ADF1F5C|nr:DUF3108 domain-containing protein [Rhizobacter sp. AJA081-3]QTN23437.1 DUF3108 domain-containing protein [Rhizobacter sp. AJA081-3]
MLSAGSDPRRNRAFAALAALTLLVHVLLLRGVDLSPPAPGAATSGAVVQLRTIAAPVPAEPEPPPVAVATPAPPRPARPPARPVAVPLASPALRGDDPSARPAPPAEPELSPPPLESAAAAPMPEASQVAAADLPVAATPASAPASAPAAAGEGAPPPLYATQLPPSATLRYELRRGRLTGSGDLRWQAEAGRYALRLEGSVVGLNVLTQVSEGVLDAHGLAPTRFTDQRARRAAVAANFEREAGRIRFSGPSTEVPWQPGVQDRLSWMIQLAAVAAADPALLAEGQRITLQVVGARGDASSWSFRSLGKESLTTFGTAVDTVHLLREPRSPYDTRVEVWLDPARHHLPIRATLGTADEDRLELRLRELLPGG